MKYRIYKDNVWRPSAKHACQEWLRGLTHYVDDDTLRFFYARISNYGTAKDGLMFWLIETCAADMHNRSRVARFVAFDIFGNTVFHPNFEDCPKTTRAAYKRGMDWLKDFDAVAHTKAEVTRQQSLAEKQVEYAVNNIGEYIDSLKNTSKGV